MTCLIEGCPKDSRTRGVCPSHYIALSKMVRTGRATWLQLEQFGMALPVKQIAARLAEAQFEKSLKRLKREAN